MSFAMKICINCGDITDRSTGICTKCTEEIERIKQEKASFELILLNYWKSYGVKWLYKYKHRVKEYRGENMANMELFTDITSGSLFRDITDIANYPDRSGEDVKIDIDTLINKRQHTGPKT